MFKKRKKLLFCKLFVYMKKTTNKSPDKIRSIHGLKNIKFDLNPLNYMCFITKR